MESISSARTYSPAHLPPPCGSSVIGKEPVTTDSRRRSAKSRESFSKFMSYSFGCTLSRVHGIFPLTTQSTSKRDRIGSVSPTFCWNGIVGLYRPRIEFAETCPKHGHDTGLGYRDGLLLHSFVYGRPVCIVHLVSLVDRAVNPAGEHERTAPERPFARDPGPSLNVSQKGLHRPW